MSEAKRNNYVRRQHYVPQFYLKRFSIQQKDNYKIHLYDKVRNAHSISNIKSIAMENDYYNVELEKLKALGISDSEDWNKQELEEYFSTLETKWGVVISQIHNSYKEKESKLQELVEGFTLNDEQKKLISEFLALQAIRTPAWKNQARVLSEFFSDTEDEVLQMLSKIQYDEAFFYFHIKTGIIERLASYFYNAFDWTFGFSPVSLVTSDNPLARVFFTDRQIFINDDITISSNAKYLEHYSIALTPNVLLILNSKFSTYDACPETKTNFIVGALQHRRYARFQIINSIRNTFYDKSHKNVIQNYIKRLRYTKTPFVNVPPPFLVILPDMHHF